MDREIRPIFIKSGYCIKYFIKGFLEGFDLGILLALSIINLPFILIFTRRRV